MKKLYTTLVALLAIVQLSNAQWSTGIDIHNTNTGNVGIGTSNLFKPFTVEAGSAAGVNQGLVINSAHAYGTGQGTAGSALVFSRNRTTDISYLAAQAQIVGGNMNETTSTGGILSFYTNTPSTILTEAMRIDALQRVGIGTVSPTTQLEVSSATGTAEINIARFNNSTNGYYSAFAAAGSASNVPSWSSGSQIVEFYANPIGKGIIDSYQSPLVFQTGRNDRMMIDNAGNVGINTSDTKTYKFAVNGSAIATSITVKLYANWPDYVFKKDYKLPSLSEVKTYIDQNQHLPEMPSEAEVIKDGINLGEMVKLQTKKIEELTLYLIEKDKEIKDLKDSQQQQIDALKAQMQSLLKPANH